MNNELITLPKIDGIYDIQPLIVPAYSALETTLLLLILMLFTSVIVYFIWKLFFSSKGKAKRKIKKLHVKYSENKISTHDTVYQLCFILQQGLKLKHIGKNTLLPVKLLSNKKEWADFTKNISTLRYENKVKSRSDINTLFKNSLFWLKFWP